MSKGTRKMTQQTGGTGIAEIVTAKLPKNFMVILGTGDVHLR
jgi:hypothetical protein